jgi:hypothetical protein
MSQDHLVFKGENRIQLDEVVPTEMQSQTSMPELLLPISRGSSEAPALRYPSQRSHI